jgi:hypothetical protein
MTPESTSTIERAVENETVFRRLNDEIEAKAAETPGAFEATFVCECRDPTCRATIRLPLGQYGWIREHPTYFVVAAGHEDEPDDIGRVVQYHLAYSIVEKLGYAAALAAASYRGHPALGDDLDDED